MRDLAQLQGTWTVSALEVDGEKVDATGESRVTIKGERFTTTGMGAEYRGVLTLDESAKPRRLDMRFTSGPEKGNTNYAIYKLDGDSWTLCIATRGDKRPAKFATKAGSGIALETLTRGKIVAATEKLESAPKGPATEFEGEWQMLSGVMNGKPMDAALLQWVKRVTVGNETKVIAGPQTMLSVEFTFDASKAPKTIDYRNIAGAMKGKNQLGIYAFEAGILKVCIAAPGSARPKEFKSESGDERTYTTWRRTG